MILAEMTWPSVALLDRDRTLVVAPIAACEQHSKHLPTFTDSILCGGVASAVEAMLPSQVLLLPVQWLGASDHHLPFGATLSATVDHHISLVEDIARSSLGMGFKRLLILNGHGGNNDTMRVSLRRIQPDFPDRLLASASYWDIASAEFAEIARGPRKTMGHACEFETSMVMHLRPDLVHTSAIVDEHPESKPETRGLVYAKDFSQMTKGGAIGFPSFASAETGKKLLDAAVHRTAEVAKALLAEDITHGRVVQYCDAR